MVMYRSLSEITPKTALRNHRLHSQQRLLRNLSKICKRLSAHPISTCL